MTDGYPDYRPAHGMDRFRYLENLYGLHMDRGTDRTGLKAILSGERMALDDAPDMEEIRGNLYGRLFFRYRRGTGKLITLFM